MQKTFVTTVAAGVVSSLIVAFIMQRMSAPSQGPFRAASQREFYA